MEEHDFRAGEGQNVKTTNTMPLQNSQSHRTKCQSNRPHLLLSVQVEASRNGFARVRPRFSVAEIAASLGLKTEPKD
jgi:hypothetical protein